MRGVNSGAVIPISLLNELAGYNTDFFVDAIDDWLILSARERGYNCIKVGGNTYIKQVFGKQETVKFLGRKFKIYNYSPIRLYGVMRNYLVLWHDFKLSFAQKRKITMFYCMRWSLNILLFETNKWNKMRAMISGIWDGIWKRPSRRAKFENL